MESAIRKTVIDIVSNSQSTVLCSIDEDGYPRTMVMVPVKSEGIKTIWFSTSADTRKIEEFKANDKASICYNDGKNAIMLTGNVEIVFDQKIKRALWIDWFKKYYPQGATDPNYCLLKFNTKKASTWIGNDFAALSISE